MKELNLHLQLPQDVSTRYRSVDMTAFASGNSCFTHCLVQKLQNSAYAEFWDGLPVSALELGGLCPDLAWGFW